MHIVERTSLFAALDARGAPCLIDGSADNELRDARMSSPLGLQ